MAIYQTHPSRGERKDIAETALCRPMTVAEYRAKIKRRMLSDSAADRIRWECNQQPNWRRDAQMDEDYYDGHQVTADVLVEMDERGMTPVITNLIGPTIDVVLGMETRSRRDFLVRPEEDPRWEEVSQALTERLKTTERLSKADRACAKAYANLAKSGLGWVSVFPETNPHRYRLAVRWEDWRELDYDALGNEDDTSDWRYIRRRKFFDTDRLQAMFPTKARVIASLGSGIRDGGASWSDTQQLVEPELLRGGGHGPWRDYTRHDLEWIDYDRGRLLLEEIWYRVWVMGTVLDLPDLTSVPYDERNPAHQLVLERGGGVLRMAHWPEMRMAYWVGPECMVDMPSPLPHREFPYIPFFGMREGRTRTPYGLIRRMRSMQDEINARTTKMVWALGGTRVITDEDAVVDHDDARHEVGRMDAYIVLNAKRRATSQFKVDDNLDVSMQQFNVLQDRLQRIQDVAGVYQSMLGKKEAGADSGVAIQSLIEQGNTTLAPLNENFVAARARVGELLLAHEVAGMSRQRNVPVQVRGAAGRRQIVLNRIEVHEQTQLEVIRNNVQKARVNVVLDDLPATSTFRQQQFNRIAEMLTSIARFAPETAVKFLDLLVESADVPNKTEFLDRIRDVIGVAKDPSTMTPEEQAEHAAKQEAAKAQAELQQRAATAEVAEKEGKAAEAAARAEKVARDAEKTAADTQRIVVQIRDLLEGMQLTGAKTAKLEADTAETLQDIEHQAVAFAQGGPQEQQAVYRW